MAEVTHYPIYVRTREVSIMGTDSFAFPVIAFLCPKRADDHTSGLPVKSTDTFEPVIRVMLETHPETIRHLDAILINHDPTTDYKYRTIMVSCDLADRTSTIHHINDPLLSLDNSIIPLVVPAIPGDDGKTFAALKLFGWDLK